MTLLRIRQGDICDPAYLITVDLHRIAPFKAWNVAVFDRILFPFNEQAGALPSGNYPAISKPMVTMDSTPTLNSFDNFTETAL